MAGNLAYVHRHVPVLDEARGLFLVWMICSHAITLAALPLTHPLQYLRPRGWATTGFVMLSGFAVAAIYSRRTAILAHTVSRLYRRSLTIGLVAIVSNIVFLVARALVEGTWSLPAMLDIVTLQRPWSISSALLSTSAMLALSPALLRATARIGAPAVFLLATALALGMDALIVAAPVDWRQNQWFGSLLVPLAPAEGAYLPFPVLFQTVLAVWSFTLGALIPAPARRWVFPCGGGLGAAILLSQGVGLWTASVLFESRLLLVIGGLTLVGLVPALQPGRSLLALLGRSALVIFIVHRIIVQTLARAFGDLPSELLTGVLIVTTLLACGALAYGYQHLGHRRLRPSPEFAP